MDGQRQFEGHVAPYGIRDITRAASEIVRHQRTHVDIVAIVVFAVLRAIHAVRHSCPLGIVARALQTAGHTAGGIAATDITHTASETYGISRHHTILMRTQVIEHHTVTRLVALVEIECSEIYPRRTAHLLIHAELGSHTLMPHSVVGIVDAAWHRLIAHIDSISASLGDIWLIGYLTHVAALLHRLGHPGGSGLEGVLVIHIDARMIGESCRVGLFPLLCALDLHIDAHKGSAGIVVDDHLVFLPIALAGREHHRAGLLEHRYQIRRDDGLRKQILAGGEERRTLPFPHAVLDMEIDTVTRPYRQMAVLQSAGDLVG